MIVSPGNNRVISLEPRFIEPQDGQTKQDCENAAAKRWLRGAGLSYVEQGVTILGDDLYCDQPTRNWISTSTARSTGTGRSGRPGAIGSPTVFRFWTVRMRFG